MPAFTPRQAALWFAAQGYRVLPLHSVTDTGTCTCGNPDCSSPGKHPYAPLAPHGLKDAQTDRDTIRGWFEQHYWLSYGVTTDPFIVIDIDPRNQGDRSWSEIAGQPTRAVPHTWRVRTGGGGEHILFTNTLDIKGGDLARGVEIKARGGYIVGAGCKHASGGVYNWQPQCNPQEAPLAPPPEWLERLVQNRSYLGEPKQPQAWVNMLRETFEEGARRKALLRIVGKFATVPGNCPQMVREVMLAWNVVRCTPPLPESEVVSVCEDIFTRETASHRWLRVVGGSDHA